MSSLRTWRFEAFVLVLATVETGTVVADGTAKPAAAVVTALSALVLLGRRWRPLPSVLAAFACLTASIAIMPRSTTAQFFGSLVTFAVAGTIDEDIDAAAAWCSGAAMLAYACWVDPLGGGWPDFLLSLAFSTTMFGAGRLVHRHRHQSAALALLARRTQEAQQELARHAVLDERARIARELHDIVSHGLSVVVVQSQAARVSLEDSGGDGVVSEHLSAVESTAREALGDMRRMLGLLQVDDALGDEVAPVPGLRHLASLVHRAESAGLSVELTLPAVQALPPGLELAAYRVVQEALTNAMKHAPGSQVTVALTHEVDRLEVSVRSVGGRPAGEPSTGGHGLVGMRERVRLYDGTLETGPVVGGFAVRAEFPLRDRAMQEQR